MSIRSIVLFGLKMMGGKVFLQMRELFVLFFSFFLFSNLFQSKCSHSYTPMKPS